MRPVIVLCDSTADLNPDQYERNNIKTIPLHVSFKDDDTDYLDGVNLNNEDIYGKVEETGNTPKTGAINAAEFYGFFKPYIDEGYDIAFVCLGSKFSSTYQNACLAARELGEERFEIVDSGNLSAATGLLALKMCRYRDEGYDVHTIADKVRELVPKLSVKFTIDRLEYLYKGGRCNGFTMNIAHLLHIHPITMVQEGSLNMYKLIPGKYRKAIDFMIDMFVKDLPTMDTSMVFAVDSGHMDGEDEYMIQRLSEYIDPTNIIHGHTGCVITSHCGPKTMGIGYIVEEGVGLKK